MLKFSTMCNTTRGGSSRKQVQLRPHPICNTTSQLDFQTLMGKNLVLVKSCCVFVWTKKKRNFRSSLFYSSSSSSSYLGCFFFFIPLIIDPLILSLTILRKLQFVESSTNGFLFILLGVSVKRYVNV